MPYYNEIEWELLQEERIFESNLWTFKFPFEVPKIKKFKIKRDESYNIKVKIVFEFDLDFSKEVQKYGIIDYIKISSDIFSEEYSLKNCTRFNIVFKHEINSQGTICLFLSPSIIVFNRLDETDTSWIKEWYLNGPKNDMFFTRTIDYNKSEIFEKKLNNCPSEFQSGYKFKIETNQVASIGRYMYCKLDDGNDIFINSVPTKMNPEWSNNICISYSSEDYIKNKKLRTEIEYVISFIFGRKLIKIGEAYYNSNGIKIKENIQNPFLNDIFNIENVCLSNDNFPIPFKDFDSNNEKIMSNIINSFISLRDSLDFSTMFINYWNSTFLLPESKILLLAASLESIQKSWFNQEQNKDKNTFIEKQLFKKLIKDIKKDFNKKFKDYPELQKKFSDINNRGNNKHKELFFKEINMEIGELENEAFKYRSKSIHGDNIFSEKYVDMIIYSDVYHVIMNRVILIILGYDGNYYINNKIQPKVRNKLPYSFKELKKDIFQIKSYENDDEK